MTLREISLGYQESAGAIHTRIVELRVLEKSQTDAAPASCAGASRS